MAKIRVRRTVPPLWGHQRDALQWSSGGNLAAWFMEMRLGKTRVAIQWAINLKSHGVLVVCPMNVLHTWETELAVMLQKRVRVLRANEPDSLDWQVGGGFPHWYLTNYEQVQRNPEQVLHRPYDTIILDESTRIKNPKTKTYRSLFQWCHHPSLHGHVYCKNRAILTGLPDPESHLDFFTQLQWVYGSFMGCRNFYQWRKRYFYLSYHSWIPDSGIVAAIKETVHECAYVLTRKQANVGPRKVYEEQTAFMVGNQREIYRQVLKEFSFTHRKGIDYTKFIVTQLIWLARITGGFLPDGVTQIECQKYRMIADLLSGELRHESVVIWFRFNAEAERMQHYLRSQGWWDNRIVTGKTKHAERIEVFDDFYNGNVRVLLIQMKLGSLGIDLSTADTAIYFSNGYSMGTRYQSEDRILHIEKKVPLLYLDLVTRDTVDQDIVDVLRDKRAVSRRMLTKGIRREVIERSLQRIREQKK